jgi:alpha-tubulin suppressor-like RCC1 family protein
METWCWGDNTGGVVGISVSTSNVVMPRLVETQPGVGRVATISLAYDTACALGEGGMIECWGNNSSGEFGDNAVAASTHVPQAVPGTFQRLSLGYRAACAITQADELQCWGRNTYRGAGGPAAESVVGITTITLPGSATPIEVSAGEDFACAIGRTGATTSVYCWGKNDEGQCGVDPLTDIVWPPARIAGTDNVIEIDAGDTFACGLVDEGGTRIVKCWGSNYYDTLGVPYPTVEWSMSALTVDLF